MKLTRTLKYGLSYFLFLHLTGCGQVTDYVNSLDHEFKLCASKYVERAEFPDTFKPSFIKIRLTKSQRYKRIDFVASVKNTLNMDVLANLTCKFTLQDEGKEFILLAMYKDDELIGGSIQDYKEFGERMGETDNKDYVAYIETLTKLEKINDCLLTRESGKFSCIR